MKTVFFCHNGKNANKCNSTTQIKYTKCSFDGNWLDLQQLKYWLNFWSKNQCRMSIKFTYKTCCMRSIYYNKCLEIKMNVFWLIWKNGKSQNFWWFCKSHCVTVGSCWIRTNACLIHTNSPLMDGMHIISPFFLSYLLS